MPFAWLRTSIVLAALAAAGCSPVADGPIEPEAPAAPPRPTAAAPASAWPDRRPELSSLPDGPLGEAVRRGERLVTRTREELPDHVGADLHCTSCHLEGGTVPGAGPWVGVAAVFPDYRARTGDVDTLEDRIDDCFERSLNGTPLPADGPDLTAIVAYMTWLSRGVPIGESVEGRGFARIADPPIPDPERGREVFAARCAACHGADGEGRTTPDGGYLFPPLWGDGSFNLGAGLARLDTAAAFVRWNMPLGQGGTLTDQDAYDVAAFFTTQPRPDFARKMADWPAGGKPRDARY